MVRPPWPGAIIGLMTETPPTKPPLPPLRERLKLPGNCVDVTEHSVGTLTIIVGYKTDHRTAAVERQKVDRPKGDRDRSITSSGEP